MKSANFSWIPALVAVVALVPATGRGIGLEAAAVGSAAPLIQMLSNVSKVLSDTALATIRKIG